VVTSAISSGVKIRFGIFGCEVVRKTRIAVAVMPRVLAMSRKAGPITMRLAFFCLASTTWQALHAPRAKHARRRRPHPAHAHSRRSGPELRQVSAGVS
jgi:hypothetical protein